jgi:hypothetical protein
MLLLKAHPGKNQALFKWGKGPAIPLADFGTPPSDVMRLCVYDQTGPNSYVLAQYGSPSVSGGGTWTSKSNGWLFKSKLGAPDGITGVVLKSSPYPLKPKIQIRAKGNPALGPLPLQKNPRVVAQFKTSLGRCWGATFSNATKNTTTQFLGKSD